MWELSDISTFLLSTHLHFLGTLFQNSVKKTFKLAWNLLHFLNFDINTKKSCDINVYSEENSVIWIAEGYTH